MTLSPILTHGRRALAALAALLVAGSAQANLLTNGSFELGVNPPVNPPYIVVSPGDGTTITGWTVGGTGGVDWVHESYWQAADGSYSLDMNALGIGSVSQTFATTPGATYTANYSLSMNPDTNGTFPIPRILDVTATNADTNAVDGTVNYTVPFNGFGSTFVDMNWTPNSFQFTATGTSTTLTFASNNDYAGGFALDNVSVEGSIDPPPPVEIPAPAGLVLGLFGAAVGFRFRRKAAAKVAA